MDLQTNRAYLNTQIRVFVITYKRTHLLKRALQSLLNQSFTSWIAEVLNDDLEDISVQKLINEIGDERIKITSAIKKRGGTGNFNYAFNHKIEEKYACILEDDNWYEPDFLKEMFYNMESNPYVQLAVANEKIWLEEKNGGWTDTKKTIWPITGMNLLFEFSVEDKCGDAKICNSSMFWKTENSYWTTPDNIPIDVTEHFRERVIPHPILLITNPLVNFSATLQTYRSKNNGWSIYQAILIASVFENIQENERKALAKNLWKKARQTNNLHITSLMHAALVCKSSSTLFKLSSIKERWQYLLTSIRRPSVLYNCIMAKSKKKEAWDFLLSKWNVK